LGWCKLVVSSLRKKKARKIGARDLNAEFGRILVKTGAIRFGLFRLSSGKLSPYYVDLRMILGDSRGLRAVMDIYEKIARSDVRQSSFDRVAGVPTAGIPYAAILAYRLRKPFLYVRKEPKSHGAQRMIEGQLLPGERVAVVDDLITTGKNTLQAVEAIRTEGGQVEDVVVLIDREEGGPAALARAGVKLHSFVSVSNLAGRLLEAGVIDQEQYDAIRAQITG
jgi:orotate phosphoribosyltransferase